MKKKLQLVTLTLALAGFLALPLVAADPATPTPHIVPQAVTLHMGDGQQFACPIPNNQAPIVWSYIASNNRIGDVNQQGYYQTGPQPDNRVQAGSAFVFCWTAEYGTLTATVTVVK